MRVHDVTGKCLTYMARHVIGCHLTQATKVQNALDDVASDICQALAAGTFTPCPRPARPPPLARQGGYWGFERVSRGY